jgi:hypothetical protein
MSSLQCRIVHQQFARAVGGLEIGQIRWAEAMTKVSGLHNYFLMFRDLRHGPRLLSGMVAQ